MKSHRASKVLQGSQPIDKTVGLKHLNRKSKNYWNLKRKPEGWIASFKKDGVFCHLERGSGCVSRDGNLFPGMEHITKEVNHLMKMNPSITHVQGELFCEDYPFQTIQGIVKKGIDLRKLDIKLHIFTVGNPHTHPTKPVAAMIRNFEHILPVSGFWTIRDKDVDREVREAVAAGHEGLVLRKLEDDGVLYKAKTNLFEEMDLEILAYEEGKGHLVGHLGKVYCAGTTDTGEFVEVKIGGGFKKSGTPDSRWDLWLHRHKLVGKTIEVAYEELTPANEYDIYSLRFAKFVKMKEDR